MSDVTTPGFETNFFLLCRHIVWYISTNISEELSTFSSLNTETADSIVFWNVGISLPSYQSLLAKRASVVV